MKIRKKSKLKRVATAGAAILFLVVTVISWPLFVPHPTTPAGFTLQSAKKVFTATDHPTLRLKAQKPAHLGFWYVPVAYAATEPTIDVTYDDKKIDVPTTVTPDGVDYVVTVDPDGQPKAGAYTVTASVPASSGAPEKASDSFVWGVLAVNFDKTVYAPGETAHVQ